MNSASRGQRIVAALKELSQFQAANGAGPAICSLTGVHVEAAPDPLGIDHAKLVVTFPGARSFDVSGEPYLEVQLRESIRLRVGVDETTIHPAQTVLDESRAYLRKKYDL